MKSDIVPKVSIILVTYFPENKSYLDLCIKSIKNLDYPKDKLEIILVGKQGFIPEYDGVFSVAPPDRERFFTPKSINYGSQFVSHDSKYLMILNDDTIMTKNSLRNMVKWAELSNGNLIVNPVSNCEHGWWYNFYDLTGLNPWNGDKYPVQMRMADVDFRHEEFMNAESKSDIVMTYDWLCMYATLIPTKAWREVKNGTTRDQNGFDENFKTGQDDVDYSWRLGACGYRFGICFDSVVWHFGGVNSTNSIDRNMRRENVEYFYKKWKKLPPNMNMESVLNMGCIL